MLVMNLVDFFTSMEWWARWSMQWSARVEGPSASAVDASAWWMAMEVEWREEKGAATVAHDATVDGITGGRGECWGEREDCGDNRDVSDDRARMLEYEPASTFATKRKPSYPGGVSLGGGHRSRSSSSKHSERSPAAAGSSTDSNPGDSSAGRSGGNRSTVPGSKPPLRSLECSSGAKVDLWHVFCYLGS